MGKMGMVMGGKGGGLRVGNEGMVKREEKRGGLMVGNERMDKGGGKGWEMRRWLRVGKKGEG